MRLALAQARLAAAAGEVPVGAVVLRHGEVIAVGHNQSIGLHDPSAHAEIQALRAAGLAVGNYRLADCELVSTLEPCAMCAGAILHARIAHVVFGARDPLAGAAGSALQLLGPPRLKPQVQGEVLAAECAALLHDFFTARRQRSSDGEPALRDDALRTPAPCFDALEPLPWAYRAVHQLPGLDGLQWLYLDEGARSAEAGPQLIFLCLHASMGWSYSFRRMLAPLLAAGHRVVVPDLIGFGRSDKPKRESYHTLSTHLGLLQQLVQYLDLQRVVLVVQGADHHLGLSLPMTDPARYCGVLLLSGPSDAPVANMPGLLARPLPTAPGSQTALRRCLPVWRAKAGQAPVWLAPFPDPGHAAALRADPLHLHAGSDPASLALWAQAQSFWSQQGLVQSLVLAPSGNTDVAPDTGSVDDGISEPGLAEARAAVGYFRL